MVEFQCKIPQNGQYRQETYHYKRSTQIMQKQTTSTIACILGDACNCNKKRALFCDDNDSDDKDSDDSDNDNGNDHHHRKHLFCRIVETFGKSMSQQPEKWLSSVTQCYLQATEPCTSRPPAFVQGLDESCWSQVAACDSVSNNSCGRISESFSASLDDN